MKDISKTEIKNPNWIYFVNLFVLLLEKIAGGVDRHNLRQSQGV